MNNKVLEHRYKEITPELIRSVKSGTDLLKQPDQLFKTLDMDYGTSNIWGEICTFFPYQCCIYSTHKHTPENPRLRLIILLSRDVGEEEYAAVSRMVVKEVGINLFDDTTYEPERLMYWPSTSRNGEFVYEEKDGSLLEPDVFLNKYDDWHDTSTWLVSSRQSEVIELTLLKPLISRALSIF